MPAFKVILGGISGRIIIKTIFSSGYRLILSHFLSGDFFCLGFRFYFRDSFSVLAFSFYFFK
jgi:hypothetical protein